jgi:hypothetical protein
MPSMTPSTRCPPHAGEGGRRELPAHSRWPPATRAGGRASWARSGVSALAFVEDRTAGTRWRRPGARAAGGTRTRRSRPNAARHRRGRPLPAEPFGRATPTPPGPEPDRGRWMTPRPARGWRVQIGAHDLHGRWTISEQVVEVRAVDEPRARAAACRAAHVAAGCPAWRPLLRRTYVRSRVLGRVEDVRVGGRSR